MLDTGPAPKEDFQKAPVEEQTFPLSATAVLNTLDQPQAKEEAIRVKGSESVLDTTSMSREVSYHDMVASYTDLSDEGDATRVEAVSPSGSGKLSEEVARLDHEEHIRGSTPPSVEEPAVSQGLEPAVPCRPPSPDRTPSEAEGVERVVATLEEPLAPVVPDTGSPAPLPEAAVCPDTGSPAPLPEAAVCPDTESPAPLPEAAVCPDTGSPVPARDTAPLPEAAVCPDTGSPAPARDTAPLPEASSPATGSPTPSRQHSEGTRMPMEWEEVYENQRRPNLFSSRFTTKVSQ